MLAAQAVKGRPAKGAGRRGGAPPAAAWRRSCGASHCSSIVMRLLKAFCDLFPLKSVQSTQMCQGWRSARSRCGECCAARHAPGRPWSPPLLALRLSPPVWQPSVCTSGSVQAAAAHSNQRVPPPASACTRQAARSAPFELQQHWGVPAACMHSRRRRLLATQPCSSLLPLSPRHLHAERAPARKQRCSCAASRSGCRRRRPPCPPPPPIRRLPQLNQASKRQHGHLHQARRWPSVRVAACSSRLLAMCPPAPPGSLSCPDGRGWEPLSAASPPAWLLYLFAQPGSLPPNPLATARAP